MQRRTVTCGICSRAVHAAAAVAAVVFLFAIPQSVHAQTFSVLYSFQNTTDGSNPQVGLYSNAIYGTTFLGGDPTCACGTVFELTTTGTFTTLYSFVGTGGANPIGGLLADTKGNLYGTTSQGGAESAGTVFKLSPPAQSGGAWTETVIHSFKGGTDGAHPDAGLTADSAGNLYGTTNQGGAFNYGTVFKLTKGKESVLYSFSGSPDGANPYAGVILDSAGNLYGTTNSGGASNSGTVFKLTPQGAETVLHSFNGTTDGAFPSSTLAMDASDNLYGTANQGGSQQAGSQQEGTIFEVASTGKFSVLHTFTTRPKGANPAAGVILYSDGNLYGTTTEGGDSDDDGTIFDLNPATGSFTLLHTFASGNYGNYPYTGLISDSAGNFYGATESGGTGRRGLVYKITAPAENISHKGN